MTEFNLSAAQGGLCDELDAEPISQTEEAVLARKADGTLIEITPDGEVRDPDEQAAPPPPEEIDGEAEEIPLDTSEQATPEEIEAAKPTAVELAVDVADPNDVYRVMDRADEVLILDELQERALDTFVYSFTSGGQRQTDLTVAGVSEAVRLMNERGGAQIGISEQPPVVERETRGGEEYVRVMVFARDTRRPGSGRWGTAIEPVNFQDTKRKGQWDKFAFTKALNKAERNALKKQIPEDFRQTIIAQYLGTHHMQELKPLDALKVTGGGPLAELPPPLDDDKAKAIKAEILDRYKRLRELNRLKCPPAKLNAYLGKAETESHERMELLRDTFDNWIEEEEGRLGEATPA